MNFRIVERDKTSYLSSTTVEEIVEAFGTEVRKKITCETASTKYFFQLIPHLI